MNHFRQIANELQDLGLWSFPVYRKRPLVPWREFQHQAPTAGEYTAWYHRFPYADAGIPTGPQIIVLDADSPQASRDLRSLGMPRTWVAQTRHGFHYWFKTPVDIRPRNSVGEIADHVDLRAWGGFAVAYPWRPYCTPKHLALADPPEWLLKHLLAKEELADEIPLPPIPPPARPYIGCITPWAMKARDEETLRVLSAKNGTRNHTLNSVSWILGRLVGGGELEEEDVRARLLAVAKMWEDEPLHKSMDTITRALAAGMKYPRCRQLSKLEA